MVKLLLLTMDEVLARSLNLMLRRDRAGIHRVDPGAEAVDLIRHGDFDLVVVDADSFPPGAPVRRLLPLMRRAAPLKPILVLAKPSDDCTALVGALDQIACVAKPVQRADLTAAMWRLLPRRPEAAQNVRVGRLTVNVADQRAEVDGAVVPLTRKEYEMLEFMALRRGTTVTKDMFLTHLYPDGREPEIKIIDVFVCKLRKKLAAVLGDESYVHTVWGRGYMLKSPAKSQKQA